MRNEKRKIIIFIDQYPAHPSGYKFSNEKVKFFPQKMQSMNLSVVRFFHVQYRKLLVWKIFVNVEGNSHNRGINFLMSCENLYPGDFGLNFIIS